MNACFKTRHRAPGLLFLGLALLLAVFSSAQASAISLSASDDIGDSSFNTGLNWTGGQAPSAGNDYATADFVLRTPADSGSYTFGGDSLTINNTNGPEGGFLYKGTGTTGVITVDNLILDRGAIFSVSTSSDLFQLAGNLFITAYGGSISAMQTPITISSIISGAGMLTIGPSDKTPAIPVTFSAINTYTGSISIEQGGSFVLSDTGGLAFAISAGQLANSVSGAGSAAFNGTFTFDLTNAGTVLDETWSIVDVTYLDVSFGSTFNITNFTESANVWTSNDGLYQFSEATGVLTVVPEPSVSAMIALGSLALLGGILRRRQDA